MKQINMRVVFDDFDIVPEDTEILIKDLPAPPAEGAIFDCNWEAYISDRSVVRRIKRFYEKDVLLSNIYCVEYSPEFVTYTVTLYKVSDYFGREIQLQ